jgi:putative component of toxin-antitoxin plasmid stabilization module
MIPRDKLPLWAVAEVKPARFDGATFDPDRDGARLTRELDRVRAFMADGSWRTLKEIADATGAPEASVSARLRDLRKPRFGSWTVDREHVADGVWRYRVRRGAGDAA